MLEPTEPRIVGDTGAGGPMSGERLTLVPHGEPGRLVVFEGTDGAGKTTVLEMVAERLRERGRDVLVTWQPTPDARELPLFRRYLFEPEERDAIDYRALGCASWSATGSSTFTRSSGPH